MKRICAVIGARGFGRWHVNNLAALLDEDDLLIVTTTNVDTAKALAEQKMKELMCTVPIIGVEVKDEETLEKNLLSQHDLYLLSNTARDRVIGNDIHASYAMRSAPYVKRMLLEKPFADATGNNESVRQAERFIEQLNIDGPLVGMELPFIPVADKIRTDTDLYDRLRDAEHVEMSLVTKGANKGDIINDLALHLWSLLPEEHELVMKKARMDERSAEIVADVYDLKHNNIFTYTMHLGYDPVSPGFTGIRIDDYIVVIKKEGLNNVVAEVGATSLQEAMEHPERHGRILTEVYNPLRIHLETMFKDAVLFDEEHILDSQMFLEEAMKARKGELIKLN